MQTARDRLLDIAEAIDVDVISQAEYAAWVSGLAPDEFMALLAMHDLYLGDAPEEPSTPRKQGWVIERADSPPAAPLYYAPRPHLSQWSSDPKDALRLASSEDAQTLGRALGFTTRISAS